MNILPTTRDHFPGIWEMLKDKPEFWAEFGVVSSLDEFIEWFPMEAKDSLTGIDKEEVKVCGYLNLIYPGYYASVNIVKKEGYLHPKVIRAGLVYFFAKYNLEKIIGVTRIDHVPCIRFLRMIGLHVDGIIRHHKKVNGVWTDYVLSSILRDELETL